ncbi:hypothetical protein LZ31DRAFT_76592 [Colletotrichum somersetense]|nr:hypothetical protein LZ31DRAFT_76592 [Colletotrichum somersetense]
MDSCCSSRSTRKMMCGAEGGTFLVTDDGLAKREGRGGCEDESEYSKGGNRTIDSFYSGISPPLVVFPPCKPQSIENKTFIFFFFFCTILSLLLRISPPIENPSLSHCPSVRQTFDVVTVVRSAYRCPPTQPTSPPLRIHPTLRPSIRDLTPPIITRASTLDCDGRTESPLPSPRSPRG